MTIKKPAPQISRLTAEIALARMLVQRLERLSADSAWAHLASGYRGALLRGIERLESGGKGTASAADFARLQTLMSEGFKLLEHAAQELTGSHPF